MMKIIAIIIAWFFITILFPSLGFAILLIALLIGLPLWAIAMMIKKDNPQLARRSKRRVVRTIILSSSQQANTESILGRAVVGGFIAGGFGALIGAMTGKKKTITRFLLFFDDDSQEIADVPDGTIRYREYINRLEAR
jgi:uncharacterized membrane protein